MRAPLQSLFLVFLGGLLLPTAYGQPADTTQLPEIAPREIEIRGERQIALPSLERQPLVGFASPPTVPTVPPDHQPYVASYKQELDELPESLPLPETMVEPIVPASTPRRGFVEGGSGRYYSRFFEGRALFPVSSRELVSVHGEYTGTQGFTPFEGNAIETPSDVAEAQVRFESHREPVQVSVEARGAAERYTLYGVTPATDDADRNAYSVGSTLRLQSQGSVPATAEVRYDHTQYTSHFPSLNGGNGVDFRQGQLRLRGSVTAPIPFRPHLDAAYNHSRHGGSPQDDTAFSVDVGGHLSVFQTDSSTVDVGARVLAFDSPARPSSATTPHVDATYVVPTVAVEWRIADGAILHLHNRPQLTAASLYRLYGQNPFATHAPSLRPTIETTNAETGLTLTSGPVRFAVMGGFRYAPTYRYFEPGGQGGYTDGVFRVRYGTARILRGHGQIALQGLDGVQAALGLSVRDGTLGGGNTIIPNFAPVTANAMVSVSFAEGDGYVEAQSQFEGSRYASRAETNRLDPYFTLDLEGSYALTSSIALLARADNLSFEAPTRWAGYPRPPATVSLGLRIRW